MRLFPLVAVVALLAAPAAADDVTVTFEKLMEDSARQKEIKKAIRTASKFYKEAANAEAGKRGASTRAAKEYNKLREWLDESEKNIGVNVMAHPSVVLAILDRGRIDSLDKTKRGQVEMVSVETDGRSRGALKYTLRAPRSYKPKDTQYPLVITLHDRAIDSKHPAFRGGQSTEYGRKAIFNNWEDRPVADEIVIVAPTGTPDGFKYLEGKFKDERFDDRQTLFLALGEGLTRYRTDWHKVFLEVHGSAIRLAAEQSNIFAGFIVRDREDKLPYLPDEEMFLLGNFNGAPMLYIADKKDWDKLGKPLSEAMTKYWAEAGKPENLTVIQAERDANGALQVDDGVLKEFIDKHRLPVAHKSFNWRYWNDGLIAPMPVELTRVSYVYDEKAPLEAKAGALTFKVTLESFQDEDGNELPLNKIDIKVTEAEELGLRLWDGLVNLDYPVTIVVNDKVLVDKKKYERDWDMFFDQVFPRGYFMLPIVASEVLEFENVPQYVPPEPEDGEKPADGEDAGTGDAEANDGG